MVNRYVMQINDFFNRFVFYHELLFVHFLFLLTFSPLYATSGNIIYSFDDIIVHDKLFSVNSSRQSDSISISDNKLKLMYEVKDHLTHDAVKIRNASLLRSVDSVKVDTVETLFYENDNYKVSYMLPKFSTSGSYIIRVEADSFKTAFIPVEIKKIHKREMIRTMPTVYMHKLRKNTDIELGEIVVKATKLKFYMDGDTLVYDADAFNLSEGSMIDVLIKKLPGVSMEKGGVIKVNGRKIDALLLNGKNFFDSNRELLLENMPAYMVNKIQSYERVPEKVKGTPMEKNAKKELVMNVKLKRDYSSGWLYNAEAGAGNTFFRNDENKLDGKFLARLFGMHFSDKSSLLLFANANNLNDESRPGQQGEWSPFSQSGGLTTAYMLGTAYSTNKEGKYSYNGSLDGSYHDYDEKNNTNAATFLESGDTYTRSYLAKKSYEWSASSNHSLTLQHNDNWKDLTKFLYVYVNPLFYFRKWNNHSNSGSMTLSEDVSSHLGKAWMDSIKSPACGEMLKRYAINRNMTLSKGMGHSVTEQVSALASFNPAYNDFISFTLSLFQSLTDNKNEQFEHYRLDYPNSASSSNDFRNKYMPVVNRSNSVKLSPGAAFRLDKENVNTIAVDATMSHDYTYSNSPIYLLHKLDEWSLQDNGNSTHALGMLPSMEDMLQTLDKGNSSLSKSTQDACESSVRFMHNISKEKYFNSFEIRLNMPVKHETLNYTRGTQVDTLAQRTETFLNPSVSFYHSCFEKGLMLNFDYSMSHSAPSMVNLFNMHDDSDPLNVMHGNPDLKNTLSHSLNASYADRYGKVNFNTYINIDITENAIASSFIYNKQTGVRTVKPLNVNGNWSSNVGTSIDMPVIGDYVLSMNQSLQYQYTRSVDINGTDQTQASRSVVNNNNINESLAFVWRPTDKMEYGISGQLNYQNSTSNRIDFSAINAYSFQYGAKAQIELPWNMQVSADVTMYSRRGYSESTMNTDELVLNAHLSKKIAKSNLTIMFDGFDLLGNLSNVQRYVNAQGRTESFYNVIPSYGLLHVIWRPANKKKMQ